MTGIKHNGVTVSVEDWNPWKKKPVLTVRFDEENAVYKFASFNSKESAERFVEIMERFFDGIASKEAK